VVAGTRVRAGQTVAELDRDDLTQDVIAAAADTRQAEAIRQRLLRGGRDEARRRADGERAHANAILAEAESRFQRYETLFREGVVPAAAKDEAERDLRAAQASAQIALEAQLLAKESPLVEELRKADAEVERARAQWSAARAREEHRVVRAPFDGVVLRVHTRPGETYSRLSPRPIITIADLSTYYARAEVDERDTTQVQVGQAATVGSDDGVVVGGRVTWIAPMMGRPNTRTGDPAAKHDRDVLEVIVELSGPSPWPLDQRVTVRFFK
jgi:HlyD family secretion protein